MHPVLQRVYQNRGVADKRELEYGLGGLHSYQLLTGIKQAAEIIYAVIRNQQRIIIVGDFDADGATSCAVAVRGLRKLGARYVDFLVPNRFEFGYGLTPEIVVVAADLDPQLIITVDNGISSIEGVDAARQRGIKVVITDHHLPGNVLPKADAIVNPNQPGDVFPSKFLAGVGTMFYVILALRSLMREHDWFKTAGLQEPNFATLLDLVALGTVADVVPLDHNNRVLVSQGLARIRAGHACPGIKALVEVAGRQIDRLVATDLSFAVAPRLNAAGRIEDMAIGVACLLTDDPEQARQLALRLDQLNQERRAIEQDMQAQALLSLEAMQLQEDNLPVALCLYDKDWHQGVIGILASRIKERLHRPVIAFADGGTDAEGISILKGSARSIAGLHIRDAIDAVATRNPSLVQKFGGHAMAAGLTLRLSDLPKFTETFTQEVARHITEDDLRGVLHSDGELGALDMDLLLANQIRFAGPWGQAFPEPLFDGEFTLLNYRILADRHLKLSLQHGLSGPAVEAVAFNTRDDDWPDQVDRVRIAYRLDVNHYRGQDKLQLIVEHLEPLVAGKG